MEESTDMKQRKDRAKKMLVWLGVASIAMFFGGFTSAYIVLQADHLWVRDSLPKAFYISSFIILISSGTIFLAGRSLRAENTSSLKGWLVASLLFALLFSGAQIVGWTELWGQGRNFQTDIGQRKGEYGIDYVITMQGKPLLFNEGNYYKPNDINYIEPINERVKNTFNISASFISVFSGLHLAHLMGGLVWLIMLITRVFKNGITSSTSLSLTLVSIYWHFLDILWLYLFLFLLFIR